MSDVVLVFLLLTLNGMLLITLNRFHTFLPVVSIIDFEQVNAGWVCIHHVVNK